MTILPQDCWPVEKRHEHDRRRWWKYVCKAERYVPSVYLDCFVSPYSFDAISRTSMCCSYSLHRLVTARLSGLIHLQGFFRVVISNGEVHTNRRLTRGILIYSSPSALWHDFRRMMDQGHRRGKKNVEFDIKCGVDERKIALRKEAQEAIAAKDFKRRTQTKTKGAKSSTALFFKLNAAAASIA